MEYLLSKGAEPLGRLPKKNGSLSLTVSAERGRGALKKIDCCNLIVKKLEVWYNDSADAESMAIS